MKGFKWNISTLILLLVFVTGTVGINVSKISCNKCKESYKQVQIVPTETTKDCPCKGACNSCQSCNKEKQHSCSAENDGHDYYKVTDDWTETTFEFQFLDFIYTYQIQFDLLFAETFQNHSNYYTHTYIDTSPPLELLCIFRC